jgi:hypothetical protein
LLVARQHVADAAREGERVVERQHRTARNAGDGANAEAFQQCDDQLGAGESGGGGHLQAPDYESRRSPVGALETKNPHRLALAGVG